MHPLENGTETKRKSITYNEKGHCLFPYLEHASTWSSFRDVRRRRSRPCWCFLVDFDAWHIYLRVAIYLQGDQAPVTAEACRFWYLVVSRNIQLSEQTERSFDRIVSIKTACGVRTYLSFSFVRRRLLCAIPRGELRWSNLQFWLVRNWLVTQPPHHFGRSPSRIDCQLCSFEPHRHFASRNRRATDTPATASDNWRRPATTPARTLHRLVTLQSKYIGMEKRAANWWLKVWNIRALFRANGGTAEQQLEMQFAANRQSYEIIIFDHIIYYGIMCMIFKKFICKI